MQLQRQQEAPFAHLPRNSHYARRLFLSYAPLIYHIPPGLACRLPFHLPIHRPLRLGQCLLLFLILLLLRYCLKRSTHHRIYRNSHHSVSLTPRHQNHAQVNHPSPATLPAACPFVFCRRSRGDRNPLHTPALFSPTPVLPPAYQERCRFIAHLF